MDTGFLDIDISDLNHILDVDVGRKCVLVEPNVPLDALLQETLRYNLLPEVIAEFPGITIGGAINGASLESSAFKYGQFNDTAKAYEVLLGNGEVVRASREERPDLFNGIAGSYGTFGLITAVELRLREAKNYVHLTYEPFKSHEEVLSVLEKRCNDPAIDYVEAILFDPYKGVVISGKLTDSLISPVRTFTHAYDPWFYQEAEVVAREEKIQQESVPIADYVFRYNRGAFWMGEYALTLLHFPHHRLSRYILNPWMNTRKLYEALHAMNISQEYFIQDFYVPSHRAVEFLKYSDEKLSVYPIWLCPIKSTKEDQRLSPHYLNSSMLIDIGIWGQSEAYLKDPIGMNKDFESYAKRVGARKMLYAHAYYTEDEFWNIYDREWYRTLREKYYASEAFPEIWEKVHVTTHAFQPHLLLGTLKMLIAEFESKH